MEINYDLIIKYLVTKKNTFNSKKHILVNSNLFPNKFKELLQNKYYRYGINQNNGFYNAILTLLNKNFITYNNDEEIYEFNQLTKSISIDEININIIDEKHIKYLADLLQINFLIFDFKTEIINLFHCENECNPYKPTVLIANYDNFYEPIISEIDNKKIFSYNDLNIKKIYQLLNNKLNDNLDKILNEFIPNQLNIENQTLFIKQNIDNNFNENQLNKFKKEKLIEILDKKNIKINININKMLKKDIIKLILE